MTKPAELTYPDIVRLTRAFIMQSLLIDAVALRPEKPRVRGPLPPLADRVFRVLLFQFENVLTGLCMPSIATIAASAGCVESSVKRHLRALAETEYLTWRHGKRKRVWTRKGWRVVRSSNRYRLLCPRRHLDALRRTLVNACKGRHGPLIQAVIARFSPPTEEQKEAEKIVATLAADMRPSAARTSPAPEPENPTKLPSPSSGPVEVAGVRVEDPQLGSVLAKLWAAMEKREQTGH